VAIHVNYRSRAAERGADARFPSYFLKPPSTLSTDGGRRAADGLRAAGLRRERSRSSSGARTRRIDAGDAWGHVAHVAAANDLGVYDLRYAGPRLERPLQGLGRLHAARRSSRPPS
jgi:hypothetical protein